MISSTDEGKKGKRKEEKKKGKHRERPSPPASPYSSHPKHNPSSLSIERHQTRSPPPPPFCTTRAPRPAPLHLLYSAASGTAVGVGHGGGSAAARWAALQRRAEEQGASRAGHSTRTDDGAALYPAVLAPAAPGGPSAADGDGADSAEVRVGRLKEGGEVTTKLVGEHDYRVHKMAIEPGSPYVFYSCGEDGLVQHFDLRSDSATKLFTCYSFLNDRRRVRLNSIAIDPQNPYYFSIGGSDEYVRLYDMRKFQLDDRNINQPVDTFCPKHLIKGGKVHITGIAYSYAREILVSYNDELIYLFQHNMGLGPNPVSVEPEFFDMLDQPQVYSGHRNFRTVKGVSFFGPHDEYVVSGSDCGNVFIWRKKGGELMRIMNGDKSVVNCIEPHPHFPFMATSGIDKTVKLWTPASKKVMSLPKNAKQIIASNERGREVDASRAEVTLSSDVIMHVLRLHRRQSELHMENEPASADLASDDDEAFYIGFGDAESNQRENSDPRECIVT